jgi:hypothetical protein
MTHQCEGRTVIIDPGHGQILKNGVPTYQRPPSPTYGLIEDELTLQIAIQLKSLLEAENIKVFMLRETSLAPYAPPDCSVPCIRDLLISKMLQPSEAKPLGEAQRRWRQRSGAWEACRAGTDG